MPIAEPGRPGEVGLVRDLVELSHSYGSNPDLVLAGGGNTSLKLGDHMLVKASGKALSAVRAEDFVDLDRAALQTLLDHDLGIDRDEREAAFKQAVLAARREPQRMQRPSVESVLHHLMPGRFVVHLHATLVNQFSCCQRGRHLLAQQLGDDVLWVDLVDPGFALAQALQRALSKFSAATGKPRPRAVVMQNHGLVLSGETPSEIKADFDWLFGSLAHIRHEASDPAEPTATVTVQAGEARALIDVIGPALRGLLSREGGPLRVVTFGDSSTVVDFIARAESRGLAQGGPLTPDQIVYCRSFPLWFDVQAGETAKELTTRLAAAVGGYRRSYGLPPTIVLVGGLGIFSSGDTWADADTARLVYEDAIKIMTGALRMGGIRYLPDDFRSFIEHWEVESYRREVASPSGRGGRAAGKVVLVTGAAQGFGLEIAEDLAAQGGHVALSDLNVTGACDAATALTERFGPGRALGLAIDVTDAQSVADAVHQVVRAYGGIDILVSNAGVLRAASVKTQAESDFDLSTAVNYKGYFLCVQKAVPVMAMQHQVRPDYWCDIIQINSKSGLEGSNKNFAYSGSKFGGIGLTQSFALELIDDGVKVNSICPGNFFDGPLWSDPDMGLFAQYLRTGKVPEATTVEDVKRFYESKVPMGRGCTTADVMTAIYYLVDQKYETGQALPVTGGQVMLH
jgi:NAD(P)-dependent dehydrogenase (short-subunit alcohol dehydrogenase family)/rhamnose utilization protein RhaD (predicted bifunctional aldolase and dehydrogenase)